MWKKVYTQVYQGITKEDVWTILTDINNWPQWHNDLESCTMQGPFAKGNYFMLKPKSMKAFKIVLTEVTPGHKFTDCTTFFGAKMYDSHEIEEVPNGVRFTNTLIVTGPLKYLWIKLVAQHVANTIPDETQALVNLARKVREKK